MDTLPETYYVTPNDSNLRIDLVLFNCGFFSSRSAAAKAVANKQVLVNNNLVKKNYIVSTDDVISFVQTANKDADQIDELIPLDIRFEDEHILVISKQADLITHPSNDAQKRTLMHALVQRYGKDGLCLCQGNEDRPGIVHRLDAHTSGLMICAKTNEAGEALIEQIRKRGIDRRYLALVHGIIRDNNAKISAPIRRHTSHRTKMVVGEGPGARDAITTFNTLARFSSATNDDGYTLLECKLLTGRTHQIRVHMQFIKHPVVGDQLYKSYAPKAKSASLGLTRQFLHSTHLEFNHPITNDHLSFEDALPKDLRNTLLCVKERMFEITDAYEKYSSLL